MSKWRDSVNSLKHWRRRQGNLTFGQGKVSTLDVHDTSQSLYYPVVHSGNLAVLLVHPNMEGHMSLPPRLTAEALQIAADESESKRTRAVALMLALGPVSELPRLSRVAAERNLSALFNRLRESAQNLAFQDATGHWRPNDDDTVACLERIKTKRRSSCVVWMIHGGLSSAWKEFGTYIERSMELKYIEFDDPHVLKVLVTERVTTMASMATFAVAVMSREDAMPDGTMRARQNVVHEIGIAQGYLGMDRVIIMREDGVESFTNMSGLIYIPFHRDHLREAVLKLQQAIETRLD